MLLMLNQGNDPNGNYRTELEQAPVKMISCIIGGIGNQSPNYHPSDLPLPIPYLHQPT